MGPPETVVEEKSPHLPRCELVTHSSSDKSPMSIWDCFSSLTAHVTTCGKQRKPFRGWSRERVSHRHQAEHAGPAQGSDGVMKTALALSISPQHGGHQVGISNEGTLTKDCALGVAIMTSGL